MKCNLCGGSFKRAIPHQKYCSATCAKWVQDNEELNNVRAELENLVQEAQQMQFKRRNDEI